MAWPVHDIVIAWGSVSFHLLGQPAEGQTASPSSSGRCFPKSQGSRGILACSLHIQHPGAEAAEPASPVPAEPREAAVAWRPRAELSASLSGPQLGFKGPACDEGRACKLRGTRSGQDPHDSQGVLQRAQETGP